MTEKARRHKMINLLVSNCVTMRLTKEISFSSYQIVASAEISNFTEVYGQFRLSGSLVVQNESDLNDQLNFGRGAMQCLFFYASALKYNRNFESTQLILNLSMLCSQSIFRNISGEQSNSKKDNCPQFTPIQGPIASIIRTNLLCGHF